MNKSPKRKYSTAVIATTIFAVSVLVFAFWPPQSTTLDYPFDQVVEYLNDSFHTNITTRSLVWAWGPSFLATDTVYFVETKSYSPHDRLEFQARFGQIGAEYNDFVVRKRTPNKTSISIDQKTSPFIPYVSWFGERSSLWKLKRDADQWHERKSAEQVGAGYPPQGVGSPDP